MAWEGLTPEQQTIAAAVYNRITDSSNSVDFDSTNLGTADNVLMVSRDGTQGGYKPLSEVIDRIESDINEDLSEAEQKAAELKGNLEEIGAAEAIRVQGVYQSDLLTIASECEEVKSRIKNIKFSLTNEGLLHIEEVSA